MEKDFKLGKVLKFRENILNIESDKLQKLFEMLNNLTAQKISLLKDINRNSNEMEKYKRDGKFELIFLYHNFINILILMKKNMDNMISKLNINNEIQRKKNIKSF